MSEAGDIEKTQGIPWGEADRITRASAFLAFSHALMPEAWSDGERFFRFAECVFRIFDLTTKTAQGYALTGAMEHIAANPRPNGETVQ